MRCDESDKDVTVFETIYRREERLQTRRTLRGQLRSQMIVADYILIEHVRLNTTEDVRAVEVGQLLCG